MEKPEERLRRWQAATPRMVPLRDIKTDAGLQPRALEIAPAKGRDRLEKDSEEHVARMRADLEAHPAKETEAVLLAEIKGGLYVVDGHHRLRAYKRAGRSTIPARIMAVSRHEAAIVSKLVNCDGVKLPMHKAQAAEAAWQYLPHVTGQGRLPRTPDDSLRSLEGRFGVSRSTLARMEGRLPNVVLANFDSPSLDPATRWPRWTYVKGNAIRDRFADVPPEARWRASVERTASKLAALRETVGPQVFRDAAALLICEDDDDALDTLGDLAGIVADY